MQIVLVTSMSQEVLFGSNLRKRCALFIASTLYSLHPAPIQLTPPPPAAPLGGLPPPPQSPLWSPAGA